MNLLECYVTEVLSKPFRYYGKWFVDVKFDCYSVISQTKLMFETKEEAEKVDVGYEFLN